MATTDPHRAPDPYDDQGAQIIVLRDEHTGQLVAHDADEDSRAEAVTEARRRKAVWEHRNAGAAARAGTLPRQMIAAFAAGTVNLMLAKIMQEEIVPATAKEAADVAKTAHEIYMKHAGVANPKDLTPAERKQREDDVAALTEKLAERAKAADAQLGGALPEGVSPADAGEDEPVVWEHDEAVPAAD